MKKQEIDIKKKRKEIISFIKKYKNISLFYIPLILIILFGSYIRTRNLPLLQGKYPLALDPYVFLRYSEYIVEHGSLIVQDMMRYVPLGSTTSGENIFLSYVIVYLYKFLHFFSPDITVAYVDIIYPVVFFVFSMLFFFLLVKEIFNKKVAILASLFLSVIPAYLYRTMAGFSDKEPLALFLMYVIFYFYVKAVKVEGRKSLIFALVAGVATGLMGLSWGGFKFILLIIALFNLVLFFLNKLNKRLIFVYVLWLLPFLFILSFFTIRYGGLKGIITSTNTALPFLIIILVLIDFLINKIKIIKNISMPRSIKTFCLLFLFGLVSLFFMNKLFLIKIIQEVKLQLLHPTGIGRLMTTVAESKQPYFYNWTGNFGFFFYIFMIGSIVLFYYSLKPMGKVNWKIIFVYILFISGLIFSRVSPYSVLNGDNRISEIVFFGGIILFVLYILMGYLYLFYKNKSFYKNINKLNSLYIFSFIWFFVMIIAARGALRLFLMVTPIAMIMGAFFIVKIFKITNRFNDKMYKYGVLALIVIIIAPIIYGFANASLMQARYTGPSFNGQWQYAMGWVKENTDEDAVFAHWWDYGYWVQTGGKRATVLDGGNYIPYWNHLMARHVLAGKTNKEALQFLKVHNVSHLLIISDEIGKYSAYSSIGSDERYDIFSWIGTYVMIPRASEVKGNKTLYYFQGGTTLDEDFIYEEKVYPAKQTAIAGFIIPVSEIDDEIEIKQPTAVLYYQNQRVEVPVGCVYDEDFIYFNKTGLKGCLRIMPRYLNMQYQQENGALLYVSGKGLDTLWTKLFLFNEDNPYFKLVFDDSGTNALAYYNGRILGPLRIWEVNYPENLKILDKVRKEYINTTSPLWMNVSERSVWYE